MDIYYRKLTENTWTERATDVATQSYFNSARIEFYQAVGNTAEAWFDDFIVYEGDIATITIPETLTNPVSVKGDYCIGTPASASDGTVAVIGAAYDTVNDVIFYADVKNNSLKKGVALSKTETFTLPTMSKDDKAVFLVWDSIENGKPMADAQGYTFKNLAGTAAPSEGQAVGITDTVNYNQVTLEGYVGSVAAVTASLSKGGSVCAVLQVAPNSNGMVKANIAIDPDVCESGDYTLRVNYGGDTNISKTVKLTCSDAPYDEVDSVDDFISFINDYANEETKQAVQDPVVAALAYEYFTKLAGENGFTDFNSFSKGLQESLTAKSKLDAINDAVTKKEWYTLETMFTDTYVNFLGTSATDLQGVNSTKDALLRMTGNYTSANGAVADFKAAIVAQKNAEALLGGGDSFGSVAGGYAGGPMGSPSAPAGGDTVVGDHQVIATVELQDLDSVSWAKDQILKLQGLNIVNGAGDGKFYPENNVTREEFLKMAMKAAGIKVDIGNIPFEDVAKDAWYYEDVAMAYTCGIVNGVDEKNFGIGRNITRADMAVMMKRILDYCGVEIKPVIAAFVFDDFKDVPEYAEDSISALCEAKLMNGMGDNSFKPMASATRAEAAVVVYRIYDYIN